MATPCDAQSLMDAAKCLECAIPPGMQMAVLINLLCQIANSGGGGGGGCTCTPDQIFAQTDQSQIPGLDTEQSLVDSGVGSVTVAANIMKPGSTIQVNGFYRVDCSASGSAVTPTVRFKINGVTAASTATSPTFIFTNAGDIVMYLFSVQMVVLNGGLALANMTVESPGQSGACSTEVNAFPFVVAGANTFDVTFQSDVADAFVVTCQNLEMLLFQPA